MRMDTMFYTQRLHTYVIVMDGIPSFCNCVVENCLGFGQHIIRRILHALLYAILERRLGGTVCHFGAKVKKELR